MNTYRARFFVLALLLSLLYSLSVAQQAPQPTSSQVAALDKSGKEASCDGALEIIPSGQVTFVRKRYAAAKPKPKPAKPRSNLRR